MEPPATDAPSVPQSEKPPPSQAVLLKRARAKAAIKRGKRTGRIEDGQYEVNGFVRRIPQWWFTFARTVVMNGGNASAAYRMARPSALGNVGSIMERAQRLTRNPVVIELMNRERAVLMERGRMSRDEWDRIITDVARFDIRNFLRANESTGELELDPEWKSRLDGHVLETLEQTSTTLESGAVVNRLKIKVASKLEALNLYGKAMGWTAPDPKLKVPIDAKAVVLAPMESLPLQSSGPGGAALPPIGAGEQVPPAEPRNLLPNEQEAVEVKGDESKKSGG